MQFGLTEKTLTLVACILGLLPLPVAGGVKQGAADGMQVEHVLSINATPTAIYKALGKIGRWWNPAHTWSGNADNLSLDLRAGGCFCERWKEGSAEHGRVVMAVRDTSVRLHAALGPLQEMALAGALTFSIASQATGSKLTVIYRVSGDSMHDLSKIAPAVDQVIGEQTRRLKQFVETGTPQQ